MFQTVMLSGFTIWFWALVAVRAFSHFVIVHSLYKDRFNTFTTLLMSFGFTLFYEIIAYNFTYFPVNEYDYNYIFAQIIKHICIFAFVIFATEKSKFKKTVFKCIFVDFLIICLTSITGIADMFLITNVKPELAQFRNSLSYYEWSKTEFILMTTLTLIMSYLVVFFVKLFKVNRQNTFQFKYLYFYLVPIICCFPLLSMINLSENALGNIDEHDMFFLNATFAKIELIAFLLDVVIAFTAIFVIDAIQKSDEKMKKLAQTVAKNEFEAKNIEFINSEKEETRKLRHDMRNILSLANGFISSGDTEKAQNLINQASKELSSVSGVPLCRNNIINTALYIKSNEAKQEEVYLKINIDENCDIMIDDFDLSRIILNLCDNAINAAKECNDKSVSVNIEVNSKTIKINISNHFVKTKKSPKPGHGNGEKIIKETAKKYGGSYQKTYDNDICKVESIMRNVELIR